MEMTVYDAEGQFLTGSYMDYALPRASDVPSFVVAAHPMPAKTNPLGVKGCGEAGCAGALTSVMNAVVDALSEYGIRHIDMPRPRSGSGRRSMRPQPVRRPRSFPRPRRRADRDS